jgi:hypothetical protein
MQDIHGSYLGVNTYEIRTFVPLKNYVTSEQI